MPISQHTFAGANTDDDASAKPESNFDAGLNLHLESGNVAPATGNVLVASLPPPSTGQTLSLGAIEDEATDTAIVFYWNSAGQHRLVRYTPTGTGTETLVLEWAGLNLAPELVLQGRVIGGILVYRDANGEPRAIPLARAEAGVFTTTYLAREPFALHLVKVPPAMPPTAARKSATGNDSREELRIIQSKAYQFAYRWHYVDGETTPISPYSAWLDVLADPASTDLASILVALPADIPTGVAQVDVLVREAGATVWQVADTLVRGPAGVLPASLAFYGQILAGAATEAETAKLYETCWPCQALEIAGSRVFEANLLEGYPTPEPKFAAEVVLDNAETVTYEVFTYQSDGFEPGPPSQNGEPVPDVPVTYTNYFIQKTGTYPDPASTYQLVTRISGSNPVRYMLSSDIFTYQQAFVDSAAPNESSRDISQAPGVFSVANDGNVSTFHERSSYRVTVQFYDALGRPGGCSMPVTVRIPARPIGDTSYRSIRAALTTTNPAALNVEIPAWATTYQFLVARNDTTIYFLQGRSADVLGYLGQEIKVAQDGSRSESPQITDGTRNNHQKLVVDIGNFVAAGQGYSFVEGSGDTLLFLVENKEFPILAQRGDYLEIDWADYPRATLDAEGHSQARIEIRSPNTTPTALYYERGPRMRVTRTQVGGVEMRDYSQRSVLLQGDCFLVGLRFPFVDRSNTDDEEGTYIPPNVKSYVEDPAGPILVESMVPPFRFAPTSTVTKTVYEKREKGGFFSNLLSNPLNLFSLPLALFNSSKYLLSDDPDTPGNTALSTANTRSRTAANLVWLDMSWGGRPGVVIPPQLQQVQRNIIRHSNVKQNGNRINGLGSFEALSFYDKLPQELGDVVRMSVADQAQSDGTVLLVNQEQGPTSLYLGQQAIQADPNTQLLAYTDKVIGNGTALRGGYGCVDPGSIARYAGTVFYYSRERRELVRYNKGLVPLGLQYKFRVRLEELAARYNNARITGCFDPNRQEYLLTYHPAEGLPGATIAWSERRQAWADEISMVPTAASGVNVELVAWDGAQLYRHLPNAPVGTFFGVYTAPWVRLTAATPDGASKRWMSLEVRTEGGLWHAERITTDTGQASRTRPAWWSRREGIWRLVQGLRRNELSPGFPSAAQALDQGQPLASPRATFTFQCPLLGPQPLSAILVSWQARAGQGMNA